MQPDIKTLELSVREGEAREYGGLVSPLCL